MKRVKKSFISWYYNVVDAKREVILEMTLDKYNEDGIEEYYLIIESNKKSLCREIKLSEQEVIWSKQEVSYGDNHFTHDKIEIDIQDGTYHIQGKITFAEQKGTFKSNWQSGIMGPYRYLPFLQSYHDVTSLSHQLTGNMMINDETIDFTEGKGYIEKEWGKEPPKVWVWAQCNHFKQHDIALMVGIARMPLLWEYYTSFSVPVYYKGQLEVFSNYNGGQIAKLYRYKGYVHLIITQKNKVLDLKIYGDDEVDLVTSRNSHMIRDVYYCNMVKMEIKMMQSNHVILEDVGCCANIEMGGITSKLK